MQTIITITLPDDTSIGDQIALKLLLADSLRAFITSRRGDYVTRRYGSEGHPASFLKTKQQLTDQRLRIATRLLDHIWDTTVDFITESDCPLKAP
jgi:hypothetical protein